MSTLHALIDAVESNKNLTLPEKIRTLTQYYFKQPPKGDGAMTTKEVANLMLTIENLATEEIVKQRG